MDSLEFMKQQDDYSADIIYSDPPYALGSEIIIRPDGKVDYKNASDFMNKWEMPTGDWWEQWFTEAYRSLKHGGYCIMFGMDRQLLLFKYYAHLAGFTEKQSMYWYFISNFPKATNLANMIAKRDGAGSQGSTFPVKSEYQDYTLTPLAQKYSGYKYSIAPLKQTNETIMIFQKPYKTKSCLHDTLAFEQGDESISVGVVDIDGNRVEITDGADLARQNKVDDGIFGVGNNNNNNAQQLKEQGLPPAGRYPSQTLCDTGASELLGEPSKILHKCDFELNEHDLYIYQPKVSKKERNAGCEEMEAKPNNKYAQDKWTIENMGFAKSEPATNNHPTLKPIALNEKILKLFKTPNDQRIIFPFGGAGSEIIGGIKAGFTNWSACEINPEYVEIAKARIEHWTAKEEQMELV